MVPTRSFRDAISATRHLLDEQSQQQAPMNATEVQYLREQQLRLHGAPPSLLELRESINEQQPEIDVSQNLTCTFEGETREDLEDKLELAKLSLKYERRIIKKIEEEMKEQWSSGNILNHKKKLESHKLIQEVYIQNNLLNIITEPLEMYNRKEKKMGDLGQFHITFNCKEGEEKHKILNLTKSYGIYDHPCVKDTKPCFGNVEEILIKQFQGREVFLIIDTLIDYLQSLPGSRPYAEPKTWIRKAKKYKKEINFDNRGELRKGNSGHGASLTISADSISFAGETFFSDGRTTNEASSLNGETT